MSHEASKPKESQEREMNEATRREGFLDDLKGRFVMLPTDILLDEQAGKLTPQDVYFYCYLLAKQGHNEKLWWGYDSLKLLTGMCESVMKKSIERLVTSGHIRRKRRRDKPAVTYCQTRVTKDREIVVRGVKVGDAKKESDASHAPVPIQTRVFGATSDRNASGRQKVPHADTSLN